MDTAPNSPMARALLRIRPYSSAHLMLGSVTRRKICQPLAPRMRAASSCALPCACINGISSRATKGKVTNTVASTMPGTAKITCRPLASSQPPSAALTPNTSTSARPAITGETENGRSISVSSRLLPRKSNLVTAQATAMPKMALSGRAMAAASRVSLMAESASGSVMAAQYTCSPWRKASTKMLISGTSRNSAMNSSAVPISMRRSQGDSLVGDVVGRDIGSSSLRPAGGDAARLAAGSGSAAARRR